MSSLLEPHLPYRLYWKSSFRESSMPMGSFASRLEAEAAIPKARDDLISFMVEDLEIEQIKMGEFVVEGPDNFMH